MNIHTIFAEKEWVPLPKAALAAGSTIKEIHRVIDEHLLPESVMVSKPVRAISVMGCALARFYFGMSSRLTKDERLAVIQQVAENILTSNKSNLIVQRGDLSIDLTNILQETVKVLSEMSEAESSIYSDPEILNGEPVFKGTRTPVYFIAASLDAGDSVERILKAFPNLSEQLVAAAQSYALAHPRKGRPPSKIESNGGRLISRKSVSLT